MKSNRPKYSICMINLNMENTIEAALRSIATQIDNKFEIVLVDGGSSDQSVSIIQKLQQEFTTIRLETLPRDRKRRIGADRNRSVELARGEYILLNIDCDDIYGPHIEDWVQCFHLIEKASGRDVLVSGEHINMLRRSMFLKIGGYKNIRFEDRDLWMRCASNGQWVPWRHQDFVQRMKRTKKQKLFKIFIENAYGVLSDFQHGLSLRAFLKIQTQQLLTRINSNSIIKLVYAFPLFFVSLFMDNLSEDHSFNPVSFSDFKKRATKTLVEMPTVDTEFLANKFRHRESYKIFLEPNNNNSLELQK